jgi:hypothetical protein
MTRLLALPVLSLWAVSLYADNALHLGTPQLDRPTLTALGVQVPVTGDDNNNSVVTVRYREARTEVWRNALPLFRVRSAGGAWPVKPSFAGSIFDLKPGTTYEIELHASDPDGGGQVLTLRATTRAVPKDPALPRDVPVSTRQELAAALAAARPGDVIHLADGVYTGPFQISAAGTAENPIVIRGTSEEGTILDGNGCKDCNELEVYGRGFVHVERLSIRNAQRAIRFQGVGSEGIVVRRVHTLNTTMGFGANKDQKDFYLCDNTLEGRLHWPAKYTDDAGAHANDDGIQVQGSGHVVCHNRITGFGDATKTEQDGARAVDFYGNDVLYSYDNGIELDESEGNSRCFRNRYMNTYEAISVQPIYGGPAYIFRNVVLNTDREQIKFHSLGGKEDPNGVLVFHNTFVSPFHAINLETPVMSHHLIIANNLFVGPKGLGLKPVVNWTGRLEDATFDYNGYFPDGVFFFNLEQPRMHYFTSFAELREMGMEQHGAALAAPVFRGGLAAVPHEEMAAPGDVELAAGSAALDRGIVLPNLNDGFTGAAPDLGAVEAGCPQPVYGPRPEGMDESNEALGCEPGKGASDETAGAAAAMFSRRHGLAGESVPALNALPPRRIAEDALWVAAAGETGAANYYFTPRNFPGDKQEASVREAYIELRLQALLATVGAHKCGEWDQAVGRIEEADPGLPFTGLSGFSAFTRRLRYQYLVGAAEQACGRTGAALKRWERLSKSRAAPDSPDYAFPLLAAFRLNPERARPGLEAALQSMTKTLSDATGETRATLLYTQGLLQLVLGKQEAAVASFQASAAAASGMLRYLNLDVLRTIEKPTF